MNNTPKTPKSRSLDFEPTFRRVAQTNQWNSAFACIASIAGKSIGEVRKVAAKEFKLPADGRLLATEKLIAGLLAHYDWWVASQYREAKVVSDLPNLALILLSRRPDQFALFHRQKFKDGRLPVSYLINPALGLPQDQQFRLDVEPMLPCKYLHICLMSAYLKDFW